MKFHAVTLCLVSLPALLVSQATPSMRTPATASADAQALTKVHQVNRAEIALGQLAQQKGENPKVRSFAQRMAVDYRDNDVEVAALAKQLGVAVGLQKDNKDSPVFTGSKQLDSDFLRAVIDRHRAAIAALRADQAKVSQNIVRNFIERTLLVWQQHLDTAVSLQSPSAK